MTTGAAGPPEAREAPGRSKVALVTGAGRGIGLSIASALCRQGYGLCVHYFDLASTEEALRDSLRAGATEPLLVRGDLSRAETAQEVVAACYEHFGGLDVLVNNAAVIAFAPLAEITPEMADYIYAVNFRAPLLLSQAASRRLMADGRGGAIVNVASVHQERVTDRDLLYGTMKAALGRLTMSLAYELGPAGIRVNAVAPGRIEVPDKRSGPGPQRREAIARAIPSGRAGTPDDVARAVCFLASEQASYITGAVVRVDGGMNLPLATAHSEDGPFFF